MRAVILALGWGLVASLPALSDDSAAAIAAGGLVARRETRIVMAREVLQISLKKVVVDYDFRNDTDQDVTTEVAFPVPPYENGTPMVLPAKQSFSDFRLWVDGKPVHFEVEETATLKGKDVTAILKANNIDISTFGHYEGKDDANHFFHETTLDFEKLSNPVKNELVKAGLFDGWGESTYANWTVHLQYHWTQTFPAHSTIHIRHEYTPAIGFAYIDSAVDIFDALSAPAHTAKADLDATQLLTGFCLNQSVIAAFARRLHFNQSAARTDTEKLFAGTMTPQWVDFILTSANTWKRPIEDFTLIIERPKPEHGGKVFINFCPPANGEVEKTDVDLFQFHLTNFVPVSELHIGFFELPQAKAAQPAIK